MTDNKAQARFDDTLTGIYIERITVHDKDVAREAQRWTTGERGRIVDDPDELAAADLSAFVTEAVKIGAHALSAAGQAQDARAVEQMMRDLGEKAAETSTKAVEVTERAVKSASDAVARASEDAKRRSATPTRPRARSCRTRPRPSSRKSVGSSGATTPKSSSAWCRCWRSSALIWTPRPR